ncbi:MAG: TIGR02147 family protein [Proteobacteria bacterium]|nr:MAG: TIGR02147 family protein [Pseudomonadota bacterium]
MRRAITVNKANLARSVASYLNQEYKKRVLKNSAYSLRAFAKSLKLSPAHLSLIIRGKRKLSVSSAEKVAERMSLGESERDYFLVLAEIDNASESARPVLRRKLDRMSSRLGTVRISDPVALRGVNWRHLLILILAESASTDGAVIKTVKLAAALGMSDQESRSAIRTLLNALLLEKVAGKLKRTNRQLLIQPANDKTSFESFHLEYLARVSELVKMRKSPERFSAVEFISIPQSKVAEARQRANDFLDELTAFSDDDDSETLLEVAVHLNVSSLSDFS